jgi:nucleoside-diphosphate-sugar epimerase
MSHVVPDLVQKVARGQDPLHLLGRGDQVRHFTAGRDLARGVRLCIEHPAAVNEDFNLSTARGHTVLEVAEIIWRMLRPEKPFRYQCDEPFTYDVQRRVPSTEKARRLIGFEATTPLEKILEEVVPWVVTQIALGHM